MSVGISPQCFACSRLRGIIPNLGWACDAFGDKPIPKEILVNAADHREPFPGDNGLRFEEKEEIETRADAAEPTREDPLRAAGIMFQAPDGAILMVRRTDPAHPGAWAFPGGCIEDGETAEEAARREAIEELGPHHEADLEPWTRRIRDGVDFTTFRQQVSERFEPVLNHEHDAFEWVLKDEQISQASAHYTDQSTNTEHCVGCSMFRAPDKCTLVEGTISPGGWCKHYEAINEPAG